MSRDSLFPDFPYRIKAGRPANAGDIGDRIMPGSSPSIRLALSSLGLLLGLSWSWGARAADLDLSKLPPPTSGVIDFQKQIQPIFELRCYACHGPEKQKSGFRLDHPEEALKGGDYGLAIKPGNSQGSPLVHYVAQIDPDLIMPPEGDPLTAEQVGWIRAWIDQGARWPEDHEVEEATSEDPRLRHWAFLPPVRPEVPAVTRTDWPRNPIDAFILARLEKEGLEPSPEADKATLLRRATLDLTGLPPTLEELDAFLADDAPDAYEKAVDHLLAKPQYGERWARWWLDVARYADTNGFEKDRNRSIWPYRDWVIGALNQDLPFNRFALEQMAGDLLPEATLSTIVATGFHRNSMINEEGGIDVEQFRFESIVDRVHTTSTAFLGLTLACCQCHDHKYDPITQKEYYQFFAFLNNADEPEIPVPDPALARERAKIQSQLADLKSRLESQFPPYSERTDWSPVRPDSYTAQNGTLLGKLEDGSLLAFGPNPATEVYTLKFEQVMGAWDALRIEAFAPPSYETPGVGRAPNGNFVLSEIGMRSSRTGKVKIERAEADGNQEGFGVEGAFDGDPKTGWAIDDGSGDLKRSRSATFYLEKPEGTPPGGPIEVRLHQLFGGGHNLGQFRIWAGHRVREHDHPELPLADQRQLHLLTRFTQWQEEQSAKACHWTALRPTAVTSEYGATTEILDDHSVLVSGDRPNRDVTLLDFEIPATALTGIRLEALTDPSLPAGGPGRGSVLDDGTFFLSEFQAVAIPPECLDSTGEIRSATLSFSKAAATYADGGNTPERALDGQIDTGWWTKGGAGVSHTAIFEVSSPVAFSAGTRLRLTLVQKYIHQQTLGRFRISMTGEDSPLGPTGLPSEVEEILASSPEDRSQGEHRRLKDYFLSVAPELESQHRKITELRDALPKFPTTLVLQERKMPRSTHVHARGEFLRPGREVEPGVPAVLPPLPEGAPRNRLTFARWLVSEENPLVGRVTLNRRWLAFFGRGIVNTPEDFGMKAEAPTHPDLLDWLATEFVGQGWSLKTMDRLIVTSATYRQSSLISPDLLEKDPNNVLLARGPRLRVEAEMIRDTALAASGLLDLTLGGPSVFPPQPKGVGDLAYGKPAWIESEGKNRYRRALYTHLKRINPYPGYTVFDMPLPDTCTVARRRSNTPLQALTLMNDEVFVEASQALARRVLAEAPATTQDRLAYAFRLLLARPPQPEEVERLEVFLEKQTRRFAEGDLSPVAVAFLDPTEAPPAAADSCEAAVWTTLCRSLLNLDETITKE